ncbi:MAG: hypothetical protein ACI8RN_000196 [Glaciecola sp.]|uniref:DUF1249 domain-containing protein n=1 Tax=Congregibacter sp. TaxID=2744308 RepID=UPI0039E5B98B
MIKGPYKVDLRALHALCEANYARMLRLFSDYESCNSKRFSVDGAQVRFDVIERSRYTTLFCLKSYPVASTESPDDSGLTWLTPLVMEARAYHDAGMIEVVRFQAAGKTQGRYVYPNPSMYQQDEKNQQNSFLADWLSHCLHHGQADLAGLLNPGPQHA